LRKPDVFSPPVLGKFKTIYQIEHQSFDYLAVMQLMHNEISGLPPCAARDRLPELISPYTGLIERVFLGKLSAPDFIFLLQQHGEQSMVETMDIEQVILAFKIKATPSITAVAYVACRRNLFYEVDLSNIKIKSIEPRKRSTRDVRHFEKSLKQLSLQVAEEYIRS
jgi:hypothetical protein